jgi:hypothetical protein
MHDLAELALNKLERVYQLRIEAQEIQALIDRLQETKALADKMDEGAKRLVSAFLVLVEDGEGTQAEGDALRSAISACREGKDPREAAERALASPPVPEAAAVVEMQATESPRESDLGLVATETKKSTLLEVVEEALLAMPEEFKTKAMREHLMATNHKALDGVHPASLTVTLSRLVELGKLHRVGKGGRGKEAVFRKTKLS